MNNMIEALERIAAYPSNRSEEMSIETAREIARAALASQAKRIVELEKSFEQFKNECKSFADCRERPYGMSAQEQDAWFDCWNGIYNDIDNIDLSKYLTSSERYEKS